MGIGELAISYQLLTNLATQICFSSLPYFLSQPLFPNETVSMTCPNELCYPTQRENLWFIVNLLHKEETICPQNYI